MNRPTRSQQMLLLFIERFIAQHGYGPTYREIMRALDYKSVSTVAIHVNGLIAKGQLKKNGRSARSLEVLSQASVVDVEDTPKTNNHEAWLVNKIEIFLSSPDASEDALRAMAKTFESLRLADAKEATEAGIAILAAKKS